MSILSDGMTKKVLGGLLSLGVFLAFVVVNQWSEFSSFFALREHEAEISRCAEEVNAGSESVVIGAEYGCAIDVAAALYPSRPDRAVELCMKYNPFKNLGDGFTQEQFEQLCTSQIRKRITESDDVKGGEVKTETPTQELAINESQEEVVEKESVAKEEGVEDEGLLQTTYTNTAYGYTFSYPDGYFLAGTESFGNMPLEENVIVGVYQEGGSGLVFQVRVLDEEFAIGPGSERIKQTYTYSLEEFNEYLIEQNEEQIRAGYVEPGLKTTFAGEKAVEHWFKSFWHNEQTAIKVTKPSFVRYLEHDGMKFEVLQVISDPSEESVDAIEDSFRFIE